MRERARGLGDAGLERACNADLARYGHMETTEAVVEDQERVVPEPPKRGRKKLPRCEHNKIVGRCPQCDDEGADE